MNAQAEIASLRQMLTWPSKQSIRDILLRRIFALTQEVDYWSTFEPVSDCLFRLWCDAKPYAGPTRPVIEGIGFDIGDYYVM